MTDNAKLGKSHTPQLSVLKYSIYTGTHAIITLHAAPLCLCILLLFSRNVMHLVRAAEPHSPLLFSPQPLCFEKPKSLQ